MFETAGTLLFEARLSPKYWCGAVSYSHYCYSRIPNCHTGPSTPYQMLTGKRARWDKIRVFGFGAHQLIPNDTSAKVPGKIKGRKVILVGFANAFNEYRFFGPESRRDSISENI